MSEIQARQDPYMDELRLLGRYYRSEYVLLNRPLQSKVPVRMHLMPVITNLCNSTTASMCIGIC